MKNLLFFIVFFAAPALGFAQYAPPAGQEGSTAIPMDDLRFKSWATSCTVERGFLDIEQEELGFVDFGSEEDALGKAEGNAMNIVSLGDKGVAVLGFEKPIRNGEGFDFAVFENSFSDEFLELAYVEASSDGENFFRFPAVSLTKADVQIDGFGVLDATKIHNLAGKYRQGFGTPFDLEELKDIEGLDVNKITHIRIIDVCGDINEDYAAFDAQGNIINDPYPTPFPSGGFDLDAIGVIHNSDENSIAEQDRAFRIYPQPAKQILMIDLLYNKGFTYLSVLDISGSCLIKSDFAQEINVEHLSQGIYILRLEDREGNKISTKFLKQ